MTTYTWQIANMERNTADDGVVVCHWRCTGVDGDHSASSYGTTSHTPDPSAADFVPYADLTEATVLGWVHAAVVYHRKIRKLLLLTRLMQWQTQPKPLEHLGLLNLT
jgi:hypothetical protein